MYKNLEGGNKSGVIILRFNVDHSKLEGSWAQNKHGEIAGGTTVWKTLMA